jgi:hypothetical protein
LCKIAQPPLIPVLCATLIFAPHTRRLQKVARFAFVPLPQETQHYRKITLSIDSASLALGRNQTLAKSPRVALASESK